MEFYPTSKTSLSRPD